MVTGLRTSTWLRNTLLLAALAVVGCAAPADGEGDVVVGEDLGAALSRGDASVSDAIFIPSSHVEVGAWVVYSVGAPGARSTELLFVNHNEDAASIAVTFDVATGKTTVLAAPDDGSGPALAEALLTDIAAYAEEGAAPQTAGAVTTQNVGRLTAEAATKLLARAAARLETSGEVFLEAIRNYTAGAYYPLNTFLRQGARPKGWTDHDTLRDVRTLTQALRALPPVEAETHRWFTVGLGVDRADREAFEAFLATLRGRVYRDRAFLSTTRSKTSVMNRVETVRFDIRGRTGRDISMVSHLPREEEVVFLPGTRFDIVSVRGEFVEPAVPASDFLLGLWQDFVGVAAEHFPGVTREMVEQQFRAGKLPLIVVTLEERVPGAR